MHAPFFNHSSSQTPNHRSSQTPNPQTRDPSEEKVDKTASSILKKTPITKPTIYTANAVDTMYFSESDCEELAFSSDEEPRVLNLEELRKLQPALKNYVQKQYPNAYLSIRPWENTGYAIKNIALDDAKQVMTGFMQAYCKRDSDEKRYSPMHITCQKSQQPENTDIHVFIEFDDKIFFYTKANEIIARLGQNQTTASLEQKTIKHRAGHC